MAKRLMSDAELRRRQKAQGKIGRTTATMGLGGAAMGLGALATRKPGSLKAVEHIPGLKKVTHEGLKEGALYTGIASGGIGGVGGFNQASIYSAESRRRKQAVPVKKNIGMDMGYYGDEGTPVELEEIVVPIEKAWSPSASNFDSEAKREKRSKHYQTATAAAGGAAGAFGAAEGVRAVKEARKLKGAAGANLVAGPVLHHVGRAAGAGVAVGAAAGAHHALKRKREGSWKQYSKRDTTSAFGVDHSDNPNGQHRETEN